MATKGKKARKYSARENEGIDLGIRLANVDPLEIIRLGKIVDSNTDYAHTSQEEKDLAKYAAAYAKTNGLFATVPGIGEIGNQRVREIAGRYLRDHAPSKIRNIDSNRP